MRKASQISSIPLAQGDFASPSTRAPRRARGQLRVEALLAAAADVFAQRGFEAATMTEIAARADSSIGSLYQFFKTKDAVAEAVLRAQVDALWRCFDELAARAPALATPELGRALAGLLANFRAAQPAFASLVDTPGAPHELVAGVRRNMRDRIVDVLMSHRPAADRATVVAMAPAVQQAMKAAIALLVEFDGAERSAALRELETMLAGYLVARLAG